MKHKIFIMIAIAAAVVLISGVSILAAASPASSTDPLVTLNYLNGPFKNTVTTDINNAIKGLTDRLTKAENDLNTGGGPASDAHVFTIRSLSANNKISITAGSELIVESGTVTYTGNLTRLTGTPAAASSGTLAVNNMYVATGTVELTASSAAKIWVRNGD